jgi:serine/threonine protein kinase
MPRRVIHRDLKPENILMDDKANIKIADFGLAAVSAPFGRNLTQQCGTPEFTAPEITTGGCNSHYGLW